MTRRLLVGTALVMALVIGVALAPRQASASSNLQYIIPAALSGALLIVLVIAVVVTEHKGEPELDLADGRGPIPEPPSRLHLAPACRLTTDGLPLFCW